MPGGASRCRWTPAVTEEQSPYRTRQHRPTAIALSDERGEALAAGNRIGSGWLNLVQLTPASLVMTIRRGVANPQRDDDARSTAIWGRDE